MKTNELIHSLAMEIPEYANMDFTQRAYFRMGYKFGASTRVIGDQEYVDTARELDLLAELCVYVEYDPDIGKVPAYWKPKYPDFVSKLLGKTK